MPQAPRCNHVAQYDKYFAYPTVKYKLSIIFETPCCKGDTTLQRPDDVHSLECLTIICHTFNPTSKEQETPKHIHMYSHKPSKLL